MPLGGGQRQQFVTGVLEAFARRGGGAGRHQCRTGLVERRFQRHPQAPSTSTRNGWRAAASAVSSAFRPSSSGRTLSRASSASSVSAPDSTTLERARKRCTAERAAGPVIHWLSPLAMAVRPSRLIASLTRTNGRPCSMRLMKPMLSSRASASRTPLCTAIPACIRRSRPRPATSGLGSCIAATTRATPAPTSASAHGGCGRSGCRARGSRRRWRRVHSRRPGAGHGPRRAARRRGRASPRRPPGRPDQHAADARIRMGGVQPLARQFQGAGHVQRVGGVHSLAGSRARRSISSRNSLRSWKRR